MRLATASLVLLFACADDPSSSVDFEPTDPPVDTQPDPVDEDPTVDTTIEADGPGEMIRGLDPELLYIVDVDNGDIQIFNDTTDHVASIPVGSEPTRITRRGDQVWVTLRGDGEIVRLRIDGDTLVEEARAWVGAEPFDVIASAHTDNVYVSLSQEDAIITVDPDTLAETARIAVPGEPRWLAAPPKGSDIGDVVYVSSVGQPIVTIVDPATGVTSTRELPDMPRFTHEDCDDRMLERRITGEVAVSLNGDSIFVPAMYMDTLMPTDPVLNTEASPLDENCPQATTLVPTAVPMYYGTEVTVLAPAAISRFDPALVKLSLDADNGVETEVIHLGSVGFDTNGTRVARRGYPRSVTLRGFEGGVTAQALVTIESSDDLVILNLAQRSDEDGAPGFVSYNRLSLRTVSGPRDVIVDEDANLYLFSWLGRRLDWYDMSNFGEASERGRPIAPSREATTLLPESELDEDIRKGRRLFYASDNSTMANVTFGTSCSHCHQDGRSDGITWQFTDMWRQTPSLAGKVSDTLPLTWKNQVPTIQEEIRITTTRRMGGSGPTDEQADAVAAFIDWVRAPIRPSQPAELVRLGDEVFHRPEVGCATCHVGEAGTGGQSYDIFGETAVDTPTLRGIGATAPYFHDGSAATLRDVLERARDGSMGDTSSLTEQEMEALEAYLLER